MPFYFWRNFQNILFKNEQRKWKIKLFWNHHLKIVTVTILLYSLLDFSQHIVTLLDTYFYFISWYFFSVKITNVVILSTLFCKLLMMSLYYIRIKSNFILGKMERRYNIGNFIICMQLIKTHLFVQQNETLKSFSTESFKWSWNGF